MKADIDNKPPKEYLHLQIRLKKMKVKTCTEDLIYFLFLTKDHHHSRWCSFESLLMYFLLLLLSGNCICHVKIK